MAAVSEVHFAGGETIVVKERPGELASDSHSATGRVAANEINGGPVSINLDQITFIRARETNG